MNDTAQRCRKLEALLHREVPLSKTIGARVQGYDGRRLEVRAALEPNINVHGVAFGGSIYSVCALTGWGLLILKLEERGVDPRIVIAGAEIEYLKQIGQAIHATGELASEKDLDAFIGAYQKKGKAWIKVPVEVQLEDGTAAARFTGGYAAIGGRPRGGAERAQGMAPPGQR